MAKSGKALRPPTGKMRCAIYTRKSSEEGLEQAFNSLDAQREACAAFVLSQKHEGWVIFPLCTTTAAFPGGRWTALPYSGSWAIFARARLTWWWSIRSTD